MGNEDDMNNKDPYDLVNRISKITDDYNVGSALLVALALEISEKDMIKIIDFLEKHDIVKERLDTLFEMCKCDPDLVIDTIHFLSYGYIADKDIIKNLDSKNPIPFLDRYFSFTGDSFLDDDLMEDRVETFYKRFNKGKSR